MPAQLYQNIHPMFLALGRCEVCVRACVSLMPGEENGTTAAITEPIFDWKGPTPQRASPGEPSTVVSLGVWFYGSLGTLGGSRAMPCPATPASSQRSAGENSGLTRGLAWGSSSRKSLSVPATNSTSALMTAFGCDFEELSFSYPPYLRPRLSDPISRCTTGPRPPNIRSPDATGLASNSQQRRRGRRGRASAPADSIWKIHQCPANNLYLPCFNYNFFFSFCRL